ncbi:MAG: prolipoprotein diacylglyceryl transferase [Proteobacteria bacterium]|nr:prolipoprotein diacylglyceryl transferase [Pseudomonadota bacterium]MBI3497639.1 prolipoprotein diacylglyceryl transferase [Pseudomonadota bacterium]
MLPVIPFPMIDPVAIAIGPLAIRWYALSYIAGLLLGWRYGLWIARQRPSLVNPEAVDEFLTWATIGVVIGGRLGYVLFYQPGYHLQHPLEILMVWHGGMSFHGGALGVVAAIILFALRKGIDVRALGDVVCAATPIGLFFGRIANFINGELFGRPSDVPWAMVFPRDGLAVPRHPSQLYEATLEGLVLFLVLFVLVRNPRLRQRPGLVSGVFLAGYALARTTVEFFREPDDYLGFLVFGATMGQLLSLPMLLAGLALIVWALVRPAVQR